MDRHDQIGAAPWNLGFSGELVSCGRVLGIIGRGPVLAAHVSSTMAPPGVPAGGVEAVEGGEEPNLPSTPMRFSQAVGVLDTIPGVDRRGAAILVAE